MKVAPFFFSKTTFGEEAGLKSAPFFSPHKNAALGWKSCGFSLCFLEEINAFFWEKGEEGEKDERNNHFPTSSSWLGQSLHSRKKGEDIRESSPKTALPKKFSSCFSALFSNSPLERELASPHPLHTVWCSTMNNWALLSAQLSVASIFCCLRIFFPPTGLFIQ